MFTSFSLCAFALLIASPAVTARQGAPLSKTRKLGAPIRYQNLTLFPVYDSAAKSQNRYLTMDEGLRFRSLKVREKQGGGEVNHVLVTNAGRKPVYLMSGEVILGGQQDRVIGDDVIVPPQAKNMPVRVYCVEHGRWSGRRDFDSTAAAVAAPSLRNTAQEGAFMARVAEQPAAVNGQPVQLMAQRASGRAQQEVWDKVAAKNRAFSVTPSTGTYREVLNAKGGESAKSVKRYISELNRRFPQGPKVVGAVAAVNGRVAASDVFGDPALFRKLWPKLLRSYASEAAESANRKQPSRLLGSADAAKFVSEASSSRSRMETRGDSGINSRYEGKDARAYKLYDKGAGSTPSAPVHESVIRK